MVGRLKQSRKSLIRRLDTSFSLLVRRNTIREGTGLCPFCLKNPIEVCFHFVTRAKYSVRWDHANAIGSCGGCNYSMEFDPHRFIKFYIDKHGLGAYENLIRRSNEIKKLGVPELKQMLDDLNRELGN